MVVLSDLDAQNLQRSERKLCELQHGAPEILGQHQTPYFHNLSYRTSPFQIPEKKPVSQISHAYSCTKQESNEQRKCKTKGKCFSVEALRGSSYLKWRMH